MKKTGFATIALVMISTAAGAADLPSRAAPPVFVPPPIPAFSWTGFYVGGQAGDAFGRDYASSSAFGVPVGNASRSPNGVIGGAHAGYNFSTQSLPLFGGFSGGVIGIEGDVDGSGYRKSQALAPGNALGFTPGSPTSVRDGIQGSVRGRFGIAVDRALFYATGGVAFATFNSSYNNLGVGYDSFSHTRTGYTVGGGAEYAITNNWSLRAEYRYSDFGSFTDPLVATAPGLGLAVRRRETEQRVQGGFSYKFETIAPAPVVARY